MPLLYVQYLYIILLDNVSKDIFGLTYWENNSPKLVHRCENLWELYQQKEWADSHVAESQTNADMMK